MERGRWLPRLADRPTIFVNVPLFRLWASDPVRGEEPLRMNVVVGKSVSNRTPIFQEEMEYVVFRPYWNPPPSIVTKEIVPHARRDPVVPRAREPRDRGQRRRRRAGAARDGSRTSTRSRPAASSSGRSRGPGTRWASPSSSSRTTNNVYMHGTPAQSLFSRTRRDFSHGCIRLEDPTRLAEWVLRDKPGWTAERIEAAMQGRQGNGRRR